MSKVTVDQIENYVQKMLATLTGDRGQTAADLSKLLAVIRGDIPICSPGVQSLERPPPSAPRMTPTAATPKPKGKAKSTSKPKAKTTSDESAVDESAVDESAVDESAVDEGAESVIYEKG